MEIVTIVSGVVFGLVMGLTFALIGVFAATVLFLLIAPLFKDTLTNNPTYPEKLSLFTMVEPGHAKLKMRGGHVVGVLRGVEEGGEPEWSKNPLWAIYQRFVYGLIGMQVVVPFFQRIYTYKLPRYRSVEIDGKKEFKVVDTNDDGYRTDHVRNELTTWYFQFSGAEVQTIPVTLKGSVQIRIHKGREKDALFKTDSWNILLDQALNSVARDVIRSELTLDHVIGSVQKEIWVEAEDKSKEVYDFVRNKMSSRLKEYKIETTDNNGEKEGEKTLLELIGLDIERLDIIDFEPELSEEERAKLRAPMIERQAARGRSIAGKGEAEYQEKVLKTISEYPELAKDNVWAEAYKKAVSGGTLDAFLGALTKKFLNK